MLSVTAFSVGLGPSGCGLLAGYGGQLIWLELRGNYLITKTLPALYQTWWEPGCCLLWSGTKETEKASEECHCAL